ncbi:hypothetical protein BJF86_08840 [Serinicoccus sp. CNJ-927]|nr:hypothetical protein BJF86_08840 [Serinicoccus sp. CNJ-927]
MIPQAGSAKTSATGSETAGSDGSAVLVVTACASAVLGVESPPDALEQAETVTSVTAISVAVRV